LLDDRSGHPDSVAFRQRSDYLNAIVRRTDSEGNPIEAPLKSLFADPLVAGAWMLTATGDRRYYLLEDPVAKFGPLKPETSYAVKYVTTFDLSTKAKSFRGADVTRLGTSPQRKIARQVNLALEELTDETWEASFCKILQAITSDTKTDPLLRLVLLKRTLAIACQGSQCLQKAFGQHLSALKASTIPATVNWMDPNNSEASEQRPSAETELSTLPDFIKARDAAANDWRSLFSPVGTEYQRVGWLRQNRDKSWQCMTRRTVLGSGKLLVLLPAERGNSPQVAAAFVPVGTLDKDVAKIDAPPGPALLEGRPVYLAVPPGR
jgi:hypothetical protein